MSYHRPGDVYLKEVSHRTILESMLNIVNA